MFAGIRRTNTNTPLLRGVRCSPPCLCPKDIISGNAASPAFVCSTLKVFAIALGISRKSADRAPRKIKAEDWRAQQYYRLSLAGDTPPRLGVVMPRSQEPVHVSPGNFSQAAVLPTTEKLHVSARREHAQLNVPVIDGDAWRSCDPEPSRDPERCTSTFAPGGALMMISIDCCSERCCSERCAEA